MKKKSTLKKALKTISIKRIGRLLILPLVAIASTTAGYHGALHRYNPSTAYDNFVTLTTRAFVVGCINSVKASYEAGALPLNKAEELANDCKGAAVGVRQEVETNFDLQWLFTKAEDQQSKRSWK